MPVNPYKQFIDKFVLSAKGGVKVPFPEFVIPQSDTHSSQQIQARNAQLDNFRSQLNQHPHHSDLMLMRDGTIKGVWYLISISRSNIDI